MTNEQIEELVRDLIETHLDRRNRKAAVKWLDSLIAHEVAVNDFVSRPVEAKPKRLGEIEYSKGTKKRLAASMAALIKDWQIGDLVLNPAKPGPVARVHHVPFKGLPEGERHVLKPPKVVTTVSESRLVRKS